MPDLFETIESCRSMRRLKPDPVPDELIAKILRAGSCAPNGGNTQKWRFLVIKDPKIKQAVQVWYKKAFDEVIGPRYLSSEPPPGVTKERYMRQHAAVSYLTDHFHEAPVWIVACLEDGPNPNRAAGSRSIRPCRTWFSPSARSDSVLPSRRAICFTRRRRKRRWACRRACIPTPFFRSAIPWASSVRSAAGR